jgi:hypothetical protein
VSEETKPADSTAIAKRADPGVSAGAVELKSLDDLRWFCGTMAKSKLVPTSYQNKPEDILVCIQHGSEIGLKPLQALNTIAVIQGRPTLYGDGLPALLWGSGLLESMDEFFEGEGDRLTAVCRMKRKASEVPITRTFSVQDAKDAGLWGKAGPWQQYKRRMLQMRARSWAARDGFADVLRGLHVREEVQDYAADAPQPRPAVTLTADGRIESSEPKSLPAPPVDADEPIDGELEPAGNGNRDLF